MLLRDRGVHRPVELGPYPLESLPNDAHITTLEAQRSPKPQLLTNTATPLAQAAQEYIQHFAHHATGAVSEHRAPIAEDLGVRTKEIKGAAYYFDASHVGICALPQNAWLAGEEPTHAVAVVVLVAYGRAPEPNNLAHAWLAGAEHDIARLRALEITAAISGHIRTLGFAATAHDQAAHSLDFHKLAVLAGVAQRHNDTVMSPFLGERFALSVISTDYALQFDQPLAADAAPRYFRHWIGINGATSAREHNRLAKRASHLGPFPMETVPRVATPTTHIFEDEVPRVPRRAEFFMRARYGDLGEKAQREVQRFATKHPITHGLMPVLRSMVPYQDGEVASQGESSLIDPHANARAIKSLAYHLGADQVGICRIPRYAWYSHDAQGNEIAMAHEFAVVMLIDQGFDTMEGASGDDWISGCQSMRGYIRGAEIAGVMASFLRRKGVSARAQTNADSQVLQIPLILLAGLGELARIGELVLNPFLGPRMKSVVLTTDLPLEVDQPIDFGLQDFCSQCLKCARECPVNAIPFGDKVIFNGYEIWKPDVERCTRYRVTNPKGSACGRCMKTCPLNKITNADGALVHRLGNWLGIHARWLKPFIVPLAVRLDDALEYGRRNPVKRWWQDLEIVDGRVHIPRATNERDIDPHAATNGEKSPVGYYHAADMPTPSADTPVPANHRDAVTRANLIETVEIAVARRARGDAPPVHYLPSGEK